MVHIAATPFLTSPGGLILRVYSNFCIFEGCNRVKFGIIFCHVEVSAFKTRLQKDRKIGLEFEYWRI